MDKWIVRIRIHKMRHVGCASSSSSLILHHLLLLLFPLLLLAVRGILNLRHHKMSWPFPPGPFIV
jgi:hypothetical protein